MRQSRARTQRVTITDVGHAAGVSPATVSRVLNGTAKVDAVLAGRVQAAVRTLGYHPNAAAQGLAKGRWGTIGVLVPDLANPYFPEILKAVSAVARANGHRVMIMESEENPAVEPELVADLLRSCDGLLLCSPRMRRDQLAELVARAHPMVLVNRIVPGLAVPAISVDFYGGTTSICGHLAQLGHRDVAYLSGPEASWANGERIRALEAAAAFGLRVTVIPAGATAADGGAAAEQALAAGATAVVTYNDLVAQGALARYRQLGVDVPTELSVVGFDNLSLDWSGQATLTTVAMPRDDLGRQAAELLERLMTGSPDTEPKLLPMELLIHETTGPAAR
ncbi:LacI family DNA-binding transcriptional regulator [Kribbella sandramycini]|uniref:LacI family DNA-binding transcriptional regulator n=1 Tax=Kribbella sandramycini TaxID=60450 RepID=A0A7Y4P2H1_9ACTN|nr:LacI family transcriptional regulator [Kribbella sandramycini]NOL43114.1 LacI family DNA-binding transcriptional regulator [Kribbella sandramycini]